MLTLQNRQRRYVATVLSLVLLSSLVAACSSASSPSKSSATSSTLVVGLPAKLGSANVVGKVEQEDEGVLINQVYEPLVQEAYDSQGKLQWRPLLATSWKRISPKIWQFRLRQGVKFQNGQAFTAADAVYSINLQLNPKSPSSGDAVVANLSHATEVNKSTINVYTKLPNNFAWEALYSIGIEPKGWGVGNKQAANTTANGTGPYRVTKYSPTGTEAELERWTGYWGDNKSIIDKIKFTVIPSSGDMLAALKTGEINVGVGLDASLLASAPARIVVPGNTVEIFRIDTVPAPLNNVKVRRALNMAINRDSLMKGFYNGLAVPAHGQIVPQSAFGYNPSLTDYKYDPAAAKQIITSAGALGTKLTMMCTTDLNGQTIADLCDAVAKELDAIGLKITVNFVSLDDYINGLFAPAKKIKVPSLLWVQAGSDTLQSGDTLENWYACASMRNTFCRPKLEAQLKAATDTEDVQTEQTDLEKINAELAGQAPIIALWQLQAAVGTTAGVKGPVFPDIADGVDVWKDWSVAGGN